MSKLTTVAYDFDGVIHGYTKGWADGTIYDPPIPGALEHLHDAMDHFAVFIHTSRHPDQVAAWMGAHGFVTTTNDRCRICYGSGVNIATVIGRAHQTDRVHPPTPCGTCGGSGRIHFWNDIGILLVTDRKLPAVAYIDDRAVRFTGSWGTVWDALTEATT